MPGERESDAKRKGIRYHQEENNVTEGEDTCGQLEAEWRVRSQGDDDYRYWLEAGNRCEFCLGGKHKEVSKMKSPIIDVNISSEYLV